MKPTYCLLLSALGISGAHAVILAGDSFLTGGSPNYTAGADLAGQNPTISGWNGAWDGTATSPDVTATGLTYSGLQSSGGAVVTTSNSGRSGRQLSTTYGDTSSITIYISFLIQLDVLSTQFRAFELHNGTSSDSNRKLELGLGGSAGFPPVGGDSSTNFGIRLFNSDSFRIDLGAADTAVNLFVLRFDLGTSNNQDVLTVYRNPTLGAEPATATGTLNNFNMQFDRIALADYSGNNATWDEIRVGDSYASVLPIPEPSLSVLGLVGGIALLARRRR